jgi:hypothetical protein
MPLTSDSKAQRKYRSSEKGKKTRRAYDLKYNAEYKRKHRKDKRGGKIDRLHDHNYQQKIKKIVLSFYGKGKTALCKWRGCTINDLDMLSLDHINDDGAKHRKLVHYHLYKWVMAHKFPPGFQTLCHNHQWKKRMLGGKYAVGR